MFIKTVSTARPTYTTTHTGTRSRTTLGNGIGKIGHVKTKLIDLFEEKQEN